uniref:uncharacterized protein LOC120338257 n=1 Tax=Styela clava TaxID=7725 RepID=UPI0019395C9B|nr:uncharacterized protein LOC120338257 [Styela clava]
MSTTSSHYVCLGVAIVFLQFSVTSQATTQAVPTTPAKEIYKAVFYSKEPGKENKIECKLHYIRFDGAYLRGVKAPNHIHFNGSNFEDCKRRCCYESRFECKSFSYFRYLRQCFIMNVTREHEKVELVDFKGYTHVEIVESPVEETTQTPDETTVSIDETTEPLFWEPSTFSEQNTGTTSQTKASSTSGFHSTDGNPTTDNREDSDTTAVSTKNSNTESIVSTDGSSMEGSGSTTNLVTDGTTSTIKIAGPDKGVLEESDTPEKLVLNNCPMNCENDGECLIRETNDPIAKEEAYCKCSEGFDGEKCENIVTNSDGFPVAIIIVIVIVSIIVILLIVICVLCQLHRRKKGEYRVVSHFRKWARRGKAKQKGVEDDKDATDLEGKEITTPTTSVQSIQNSDASSASKTQV